MSANTGQELSSQKWVHSLLFTSVKGTGPTVSARRKIKSVCSVMAWRTMTGVPYAGINVKSPDLHFP